MSATPSVKTEHGLADVSSV
uniref:Uncharacterized protein n=1 Tax=Anguilla anguilla TaxID=7936 RepID=A0A0E9VK18_ANGAN